VVARRPRSQTRARPVDGEGVAGLGPRTPRSAWRAPYTIATGPTSSAITSTVTSGQASARIPNTIAAGPPTMAL